MGNTGSGRPSHGPSTNRSSDGGPSGRRRPRSAGRHSPGGEDDPCGRERGRGSDLPLQGRAGRGGRRGDRRRREPGPGPDAGRLQRVRGRHPAEHRLLRCRRAARGADGPAGARGRGVPAQPGVGERRAGRGDGPDVRDRVRRRSHDAVEGQPPQGGGGPLPRAGGARGRPGDAHLHLRRHLVERADAERPREAHRSRQAPRGPLRTRDLDGPHLGLGGPPDPRLQEPGGLRPCPPTLPDLQRDVPAPGPNRPRRACGPLSTPWSASSTASSACRDASR
jgi:hypothetical protein